MTTMTKTILACACALAVTACGPLNEGNVAAGALKAVQARLGGAAPTPAPAAPVLTPAQVAANPGGFMVMNAYNGTLVTALAAATQNGDRTTFLSPDGLSVTTQNGVMVASRGFPRDLMAADVDGTMQALIAERGTATRIHETLSGTDQIVRQTFACTVASQGRETIGIMGRQVGTEVFAETCQSDRLAFTNRYWISDDGRMVRSLQAIAPESGYVQLDRP